eukprot:COSAG02_NODE_29_length_51136_cov_346.293317_18_plen_413_part_00
MGKGQRKRQRKRLAKLGDEARRAAKRQREEQGAAGAVSAEPQRPAEQAALIRAFHTLEKKLAAVASDPSLRSEAAREAMRSSLRAEQEALGGLDAYQKASLAGESTQAYAQFSAAEWVLEELSGKPLTATHKSAQRTEPIQLPGGPDRPDTPALQLLDVGAIVNHYPPEPEQEPGLAPGGLRSHSTLGPTLPGGRRLHVTSIDLNPQEECVLKADFFDFAEEQLRLPRDASSGGRYDVVVLSLVMNFVGDPAMRGVMLRRCSELLAEGGLLFLVLPEPCLYNSRYLKFGVFEKMMRSCGVPILPGGWKRTSKLFFALCRRTERSAEREPPRSFGKKLLRNGGGMNNFCILLDGRDGDGSIDQRDGTARVASSQPPAAAARPSGGAKQKRKKNNKKSPSRVRDDNGSKETRKS